MPRLDITNQRFGRLVALEFAHKNKSHGSMWLCQCDCGNTSIVFLGDLRSGKTTSCGCYRAENTGNVHRKHGHSQCNTEQRKAYKAWLSMRYRCSGSHNAQYKNYGGRGITVCDRWADFMNFYADMGDPPEGMTLDRIDNNGNYEPSNCHWANDTEQARNTTRTLLITFNGETKKLAEWAEILGIGYHILYNRIYKSKWTIDKAFTTKYRRGLKVLVAETTAYEEFLARKQWASPDMGIDVDKSTLNPALFDFQRDIVHWALYKGRAAVFADCGMGKSIIQLEWAHRIALATGGKILILAPLAVSQQTVREGEKFGITVHICKTQEDVQPGINITNYEKLEHFTADDFIGIVLDESSILKAYGGKTRKQLNDFASVINYRLSCTATPAPNDLVEVINQAEFLGVMQGKEIIALFFMHADSTVMKWRLKRPAQREFWRWLSTWAVALRKPSDLGYSDDGFTLPPLNKHPIITAGKVIEGMMFPIEAQTMNERRGARRASLDERVNICADLVNNSSEQWLVWCDLNKEADALKKMIPGSVEVRGSDKPEYKEESLLGFAAGKIRALISKPTIAGHGMNFQSCHNIVFVGLSDSFEQMYQATRRCWRFGQKNPVECYVITSENEGAVVDNIARKEAQANEMMLELVREMSGLQLERGGRKEMEYTENVARGNDWTAYLGDSVHAIDNIESDSVGFCIFSPPFPGMYVYSNSVHDMGNTKEVDEMIDQFRFLIAKDKLYRVMMPGRSVAIHMTQIAAHDNMDGYIGKKDYRGALINVMSEAGFIYYGEVCIDKDPQYSAIRTKDRGLLFKTLANDSAHMHMTGADYILQFRKPGDNPVPIRSGISEKYNNPDGWITPEEWILWAAPVWYRDMNHGSRTALLQPDYPALHQDTPGINETNILSNYRQAKDQDDERHICPLQLDVIERCIKLWSAPGELVYDPFMGIASTGHVALQLNRRYVGSELKPSYWRVSCKNLANAVSTKAQPSMFDLFNMNSTPATESEPELIEAE